MIIRCRHCMKVFNDTKPDGRLMEGTCKRCVAEGREDLGLVVIMTLKEMLEQDPKFKERWESEGLQGLGALFFS